MEVIGSVLLGSVIGLVGPVDADFLTKSECDCIFPAIHTYVVVDATAVEGRHAALRCRWVIVLDESVIEALQEILSALHVYICATTIRRTCRLDFLDVEKINVALMSDCLTDGALTVLSGMILTLWTCPVVSKI